MRAPAVLTAVAMLLALASAQPATAAGSDPPPDFRLSSADAGDIAASHPDAQTARRTNGPLRATARTAGIGLWRVTFRDARGVVRARVAVEDRTGKALENEGAWSWVNTQEPYTPFKRRLEIIMLALAVLFVAPFVQRRRIASLRHLDLLALLAFGATFAASNRADHLIGVPLIYPPLLYLLARMLWIGLKGRHEAIFVSEWPSRVLMIGIALLVIGRIAYSLIDGLVTDVGYAGVFGANSIHHGWPLYEADRNHLDTYGPVNYLAYLPFELVFPMDENWERDYLPAAHGAAIAFDLATLAALVAVGRRLGGARGGLYLGWAWATFPFTFLVLALNVNDALVSAGVVAALLALGRPALLGAVTALAGLSKFAPLALVPLLARGDGTRGLRGVGAFGLGFAAVAVVAIVSYMPDGGPRELWETTIGFQLERRSFFSIWSQYPELEPLRAVLRAGTVIAVLAVFVLPRRRAPTQVAALAAAVIIMQQLTLTHWFPFYVVWFLPLVFVATAAVGTRRPAEPA